MSSIVSFEARADLESQCDSNNEDIQCKQCNQDREDDTYSAYNKVQNEADDTKVDKDTDDSQYSWLNSAKNKAIQPKYYCAIGASFPTYIDITNRYKGDPNSGIAVSKPKKRPFYSAAVGMRPSFNEQVAFEMEAILYRSKSKIYGYQGDFVQLSSDLESASLLLNSYYMLDGYGGFHPFIGLGAGASYNNMADIVLTPKSGGGPAKKFRDKSKISPAFQVILGLNKNLTQNIDLQVKVKAMSLGKFSGEGSEGKFRSVTVAGDIGFKYSLDKLKKR